MAQSVTVLSVVVRTNLHVGPDSARPPPVTTDDPAAITRLDRRLSTTSTIRPYSVLLVIVSVTRKLPLIVSVIVSVSYHTNNLS